MKTECKEVIITDLDSRGNGTILSPIRRITQVFEKDGTFIAEHDPLAVTFAAMDLVHFANWCSDKGINPGKVEHIDVVNWVESIGK